MTTIDDTHDPGLACWAGTAAGHPDFPVQNLPLGIFAPPGGTPRPGTRIGDDILDLPAIASLLPERVAPALTHGTLNALLALPVADRVGLRRRLSALLTGEGERTLVENALHPDASCTMHLPARIGDYTDFYAGIHHATNIGRLFRPDAPLLPNYRHMPIGYHGRASSVRVSGTPVVRPNGQRKPPAADAPTFGPCARLDYELEMGVWIGGANALGDPVAIADAPARIAGLTLLNDWSARDMQAWEYQPLGPFLAKSFLTTVSPWIVTAEALAPFRIAQSPRPEGDPRPLPYLWDEADQAAGAYAIALEATLSTARMREDGAAPHRLTAVPLSTMYWTVAQMVTHQASNGCDLNPGDLLGTGTISGPDAGTRGSLMEITVNGAEPLTLPGGETRTFLEDGDELALHARASADGFATIGFGACRGTVSPAPTSFGPMGA